MCFAQLQQDACEQDVQWVAEADPADGDSNYVRRRRWERRAVNVSVKPSSSLPGSIKIDKEGGGLLDRTNSDHTGVFAELLDAGMLPKKVSVNYLQTAGGGAAREGLLWKEGRGLLSNWERRYWVLWPKIPDEGAHQPKSLLLTCRRLTASLLFGDRGAGRAAAVLFQGHRLDAGPGRHPPALCRAPLRSRHLGRQQAPRAHRPPCQEEARHRPQQVQGGLPLLQDGVLGDQGGEGGSDGAAGSRADPRQQAGG